MEYNLFNTLKYTVVLINSVCTLKCKDCVTATPYQKNKRNYPLEELKADIDRYFEIVNAPLEHFDFIGGEPLLHPQLPELILWCAEKYGNMFEEMRVLTNGTIAISDKLLDACKQVKIRFLIDRYGDLSTHADENTRILEENGIPVRVTRYDGTDEQSNDWIDFGDFSFRNYSDADLQRMQEDCCELIGESDTIMRHHLHINNGKLGVCDRQVSAPDSVPLPECDYVDLRADVSVELLREKLKEFKLRTITCCQYCNGFILDANKRVGVPVAVQVR
ncbi:MAG: radical SAM protein [Oscillospiraceae bacterium]|nr:radical SAM protein [Oscillospiraceae bacterium]